MRELFQNRSGRVIAVFRAALAFVFFAALMVEPVSAQESVVRGQLLLGFYLALSLAVVPLIWRDWWADHLLALPLLVLDVFVFLIAVFVTEGSDADFTSPFLAIFALTILSAALRWDWRAAAQTGGIVIVAFVVAGLVLMVFELSLDHYRFFRRTLYMAALLLVLVWIGMQRSEPKVSALDPPTEDLDNESLYWAALDYARALTGAGIGLLAWNAADEPWTVLRAASSSGLRSERADPSGNQFEDFADVRLFDRRHSRKLVLGREDRAHALPMQSPMLLAQWGGIAQGLALPFSGVSGSGVIVLGDISGPGPDFLALGNAIARELGTAFDRVTVARLEREALVTRTRSSIARDLHDSVAQSLAGACFRLEALRRNIAGDGKVDPATAGTEIVSVRDALRREQSHVRTLIDTLRAPAQPPQRRDLRADIDATLADAGAHWGLRVALDAPGRVEVPGWLSHELQQLVREAVANAARHGHASRINARIEPGASRIAVHIADNGGGFDVAIREGRPWSIRERVAALGGELSVTSGPDGTCLAIFLPHASANGAFA